MILLVEDCNGQQIELFVFNVSEKKNYAGYALLIKVGDKLKIKAPYMKVSKSGFFILRVDNIENISFPDRNSLPIDESEI